MRPPGPLPATDCNSIPSSHARRRTDGEAMGRSSGLCAEGSVVGGAVTRRAAVVAVATGLAGAGGAACTTDLTAGATVATAAGAADCATAAAFKLPAPSTSMRITSEPTARTCPATPLTASTLPATGDGISTVAFSVMTSTNGWSSATMSPTLTRHSTNSTSAMPSPMSGILITCIPIDQDSIALLNAAATRAGPGK